MNERRYKAYSSPESDISLVCFLGLTLVILLAGCQGASGFQSATITPIVSQTGLEVTGTATAFQPVMDVTTTEFSAPATQTPTPTVVPPQTYTPTPQPENCEEAGRVEYHQIGAEVLPKALDVIVYLPPCFEVHPEAEYPLLILLHGQIHTNEDWLAFGVAEIADRWILSGEVLPFLIVFPREEYYLQAPEDSYFDMAVLDVLIPWMEQEFAACSERDCRAIGGISRGGAWALRLGLTNWETFGAIGAHSLVPFPPDVNRVVYWLREIPEGEVPFISIDIGDIDTYHRYAQEFHQALLDQDVEHTWTVYAGGHEDAYWQAHIEEYLRWYAFALSLSNDG